MRLHTQQTETFMATLAASIHKDPSSLENWRCLYIPCHPESTHHQLEATLIRIKEQHKDVDCDLVLCADNDVLIISRSLAVDELYHLAHAMLTSDTKPDYVHCYDLFYDWRMMCDLLREKVPATRCTADTNTPLPFHPEPFLCEAFTASRASRQGRTKLQMMVVEDDPLTRRIVCNAFKEYYALITATNAEEAIAGYLLHAPDIVFLDIGLPDASGLDVLRHIIAHDADAYVVMFSSNSYLDNVTNALSNGASGFIAKPFKKDKMHYYIMDSALHHAKIHA